LSRHGTGSRSSRRKRGLFHRTGIVIPAAGIAALAVAGVALAAYLLGPGTAGASGADAALEAIPGSHTIALLEAERQQLIVMNVAAKTLTVAAKPKLVSPSQVIASANDSGSSDSGGSSSSSSSSGGGTVTAPAPDPGTAEAIGYRLLPDYGFSQSTQWGCLYDLWMRESGWVYDAENASGAYGIPQALPASKMASAGPDYLTDPTTQIEWGLGYIKSVYGSPCAAWDFELANGYY
jgi:Transglycosylase SLT domain